MGDPGERQLPRVLMGVLAHIDVTDHHKHIRSIEVNNTLFKYIYAHKRDTRYIFNLKRWTARIPIKGPLKLGHLISKLLYLLISW